MRCEDRLRTQNGVIPLQYLGMGIKLDPIDTEVNHFYQWKVNSAGLGLASKAMGAETLGDRLCPSRQIGKVA